MLSNRTDECPSELITDTVYTLLLEIAETHELSTNELLHRALLQLPRLSDVELKNGKLISKEIRRCAQRLKHAKRKYESLLEPISKPIDLKELAFGIVPKSLANIINRNFHYIGYDRKKSTYLGLMLNHEKNRSRIVSMITLSPFDLEHVRPFLPEGAVSRHVLVVSRVYAFDWAPKNTISFMMGRMFRWLRRNKPEIKLLLTYLNPNVCFSGTSYKASNWILFGREPGLRYAYLDGDYITLRDLKRRFHTTDLDLLKRKLKDRLEFSVHLLSPLKLYSYLMDKRLRFRCQIPIKIVKDPPIA